MKLKYEFEFVQTDDTFCAVPIDENDSFRAVIQLNEVGAEILQLLQECSTRQQLYDRLCAEYSGDDPAFIKKSADDFLLRLINEGILEE